ncbi:MAG: DegT/DnrJ/EryC1/StrS family aminotransferase [Massilibacteroides sp.]|nr:DegT/DnrJ/EryC1/StrS family aminotransferase [Massilibacteroides sp.]MDD3061960.1 DegT/DnrJ/EryC1/StrS family aminotransferase [Massilibacteroides sp.]MDD4114865.1 DegT/DnrJ/EryC1/StrS family aminotransferase [Massilibacteroides sp.]MDD4659323.1 DegT/DnrJ/EryC1/StrS family aminotransferase [Massilibacteroides sp.]
MSERNIPMTDLKAVYHRLKDEIDTALLSVAESGAYINGESVKCFAEELAGYLGVPYVIPCANGTDALQIALMALRLKPGDEVLVPAFTYAAAAEAVALLGLVPVPIDVDPGTFNIDASKIENVISRQTKAIIVVHLFGQSCDMEKIVTITKKYKLFLIEDNAQSIGCDYIFSDGSRKKTGTIGDIGTTSFFPTKPLACFGDGGALITSDPELEVRCRMIAAHGQERKYYHKIIGCNSRLDTIQAAVLRVKLRHIHELTASRLEIAKRYDEQLSFVSHIQIPFKAKYSTHVYHQYTVLIENSKRDALQSWLKEKGISSVVYYPLPLHQQEAFRWCMRVATDLSVSEKLVQTALSLPVHSEMTEEEQMYIINTVKEGLAAVF